MSRPTRADPSALVTILFALGCAAVGLGWSGWRSDLRAQGYYYYGPTPTPTNQPSDTSTPPVATATAPTPTLTAPAPTGPTATPTPSGACGNGAIDTEEECDDGNSADGDCCSATCQVETGIDCGDCAAIPFHGCRQLVNPRQSLLLLEDESPDRRDELAWRWMAGEETPLSAFGDPRVSDNYAFCIYESSSGAPKLVLQARVPRDQTCRNHPCWRQAGVDGGFIYRNRTGDEEGLTRLKLVPGAAGKAKITIKGSGENLPVPTLPFDLPVIAQLRASNGECWEASYEAGVRRNDAERFRAKSGP